MEFPVERMSHAEPCALNVARPAPTESVVKRATRDDALEISSELIAGDAGVLAAVLQIFERQRQELSLRLLGDAGAFTGFARLDCSVPASEKDLENTRLVVTTTIHRRTESTSTFELAVWGAEDHSAPCLVCGTGVGVYPRLRTGERSLDKQRALVAGGSAR